MQVKVDRSDLVRDGHYIEEYLLTNDHGFNLKLSNFGCTLMSLTWPTSSGNAMDILLGYDTIAEWYKDQSFFGSTAGRCCNRIRDSRVKIGDKAYDLNANIPPHQLHGGLTGFNKKMWRGYPYSDPDQVAVKMYYNSRNMEEGFPGNLSVEATISLNNNNDLTIEYRATTDQLTICNLTSHPYFNLDGTHDILNHILWLDSDYITEIDQEFLTTGRTIAVKETPFDFTSPVRIGRQLNVTHPQLSLVEQGIDHNYILNPNSGEKIAACLRSEISGRSINIFTNQPGIQVYTANHLNLIGKGGIHYPKYAGICLETQGFPNAANIDSFPSVLLAAGEEYYSFTKIEMIG